MKKGILIIGASVEAVNARAKKLAVSGNGMTTVLTSNFCADNRRKTANASQN